MNCYNCSAKNECLMIVRPGSKTCLVNQIRYGVTKANIEPPRQKGCFCQFCGHRLKEIGSKRFCNNPQCVNRYEDA